MGRSERNGKKEKEGVGVGAEKRTLQVPSPCPTFLSRRFTRSSQLAERLRQAMAPILLRQRKSSTAISGDLFVYFAFARAGGTIAEYTGHHVFFVNEGREEGREALETEDLLMRI